MSRHIDYCIIINNNAHYCMATYVNLHNSYHAIIIISNAQQTGRYRCTLVCTICSLAIIIMDLWYYHQLLVACKSLRNHCQFLQSTWLRDVHLATLLSPQYHLNFFINLVPVGFTLFRAAGALRGTNSWGDFNGWSSCRKA